MLLIRRSCADPLRAILISPVAKEMVANVSPPSNGGSGLVVSDARIDNAHNRRYILSEPICRLKVSGCRDRGWTEK